MPLKGFVRKSSREYSFILFVFLSFFLVSSLYSLVSPRPASAAFVEIGGTCYLEYGSTSGGTLRLPVNDKFCEAESTPQACPQNTGYCQYSRVPGSLHVNCNEGGDIDVDYDADSDEYVVSFTCGGDLEWGSNGNNGGEGLCVRLFKLDGSYSNCLRGRYDGRATETNQIPNDGTMNSVERHEFRISRSVHSGLADLSIGRDFLVYPDCFNEDGGDGWEGALEMGCFRDGTSDPYVPPPPPPCTMPLEQVSYTTSCTPVVAPGGQQYSSDVVQALNLNQSGYCQIDVVRVSTYQGAPWSATWNASTGGASTKTIPGDLTWNSDRSSHLVLAPSTTYWLSYWDADSSQLTAGRSFTTKEVCPAPGIPTITQTPQCRFPYPYEPYPADLMDLKWNRPSSLGLGFSGYYLEVSTTNSSSGQVWYGTQSNDGSTVSNYTRFGSTVFGLSTGSSYYYRVRGYNWGGPGDWTSWHGPTLLRTRPTTPGNFIGVANNQTSPYIDLSWSYTNTAAAPVYPSNGWLTERTGSGYLITSHPATPTSFRDTQLLECNDTTYTYRLYGANVCGDGPIVDTSVFCPVNKPPTCGVIQYSDNGSTWTDYPAEGLTRNRSSTIQLKRTCSDPDQNGITYSWFTSSGCGTFNPSTQSLGTPSTSQTTYTFSSAYNTSCDLTSTVKDSGSHFVVPDAVVIAKTYPAVSGTHTLTVESSIRRLNTADVYEVLGGVTQDKSSLTYSITGYSNPTEQGTNKPNRPGTLTIDTTSASISGKVNICNPTYGTCRFNSTGTTTVTGITEEGTAHIIYVSFTGAQLINVNEVLLEPGNTLPKYTMRVNFSSTSADGSAISVTRDADPSIVNKVPYCEAVRFNPVSPVGSAVSSVNISVDARDDWGLKGITVYQAPSGSSSFAEIYSNASYFTGNPRAATTSSPAINWNISGISASSRYNVRIQLTDLDGQTTTCWANDNVVGSENPSDGTGTLPQVFIDKTAPQCSGSLIITPNTTGTRLGFSVTGTDPGNANTASNLNSVALTYRYATGTPSGTVASYTIPDPKPQTYTYTILNTAADAFNLDNVPSGVYTFTATWFDRANNSGLCTATYEKGSRISGKVNLYTGIDGATKRDYAYESTGTPFNPGTRPIAAGTFTGSTWQNAGGANVANCTASYPGVSGSDACVAYFVSNGVHGASSTPTVEIQFPTLSSNPSVGKYSCTMAVWRTFPSWTLLRTTTQVPGTNGVCSFTLGSGEVTVNPTGIYTTTDIWPTHVEFDLVYNSDQVYGQVMNETGSLISGNTIRTDSGADVTVSSGSYAVPAPIGDDSRGYLQTNANANVTMINPDLDRLCVWMAKNDFVNPNANLSRINAAANFRSSNIGDVARSLASAGWNVGASALCSAPVALRSGPMSPKYQNQVNFITMPKVKLTGNIYYLKDDNQCGDPSSWASNQATLPAVPVNLSFSTSNPVDVTLDDFYNPDGNPADPTGAGSYNTGDVYTVYANALPGMSWNEWQILASATFPTPEYIICPSVVDVDTSISDYPANFEINAPIGVYVKETNDWWQAYNGGAHAQGTLTNAVPENEIAYGEIVGQEIHTLVGNPTFSIFQNAGSSIGRIDNSFRGFSSGGLVSSSNELASVPIGAIGDIGKNWLFVGAMQEMRIPYTTDGSEDELAVVRKVRNLVGSDQWNPSFSSLNGTGDKRVFIDGDETVTNSLDYNGKKYLLVNGVFNIDQDITASGGDYLLVVASDGVNIGSSVGQINASIYTRGNITVESAGTDAVNEKVLKVYGGLYASGKIINGRDIQNTILNYGLPSEQIIFNPALIIGSTESDFPSQLKESNTYWIPN